MYLDYRDRLLCIGLKNVTNNPNLVPLRITINSYNEPPSKCIGHVNLVNAITSAMNVPISFDFNPSIGRKVNGHWNGAIGQLANNHSDVAIGTFSATYERSQCARFSSPLGYASPIAILSGKLSQDTIHDQYHVFNTFATNVWVCIVISILIIGLIDHVVHNDNFKLSRLITRIILSYKSMMKQSSKQLARHCCLKHMVIVGSILLGCTILIQYFGTFILSNLLHESFVTIDSIDDLVEFLSSIKSNISLISSKGQYTWRLFETSEETSFKIIYNRLIDVPYINYNDVHRGKSIALDYGHEFEHVIEANKHLDLHIGHQQYFGTAIVILYSKFIDQSVKDRIDSIINVLFESGLQSFWESLWFPESDIGFEESQEFHAIRLRSINGLFIVLAIVNSVLIIILIIEIFYHLFYTKKHHSITILMLAFFRIISLITINNNNNNYQ